MTDSVTRVTHVFPVPRDIRKYMTYPKDEIKFCFINPTEALVRLLVMFPLAGTITDVPWTYSNHNIHVHVLRMYSKPHKYRAKRAGTAMA